MGFEALHGEVSMYILFAVTPCVYTCWVDYDLLRTCLAFYSKFRGVDFSELGRLLSFSIREISKF